MEKKKGKIRTDRDGIRFVENSGNGQPGPRLRPLLVLLMLVLGIAWWRLSADRPDGRGLPEVAELPVKEQPKEQPRRHESARPSPSASVRAGARNPNALLDAETMQRLVEGTAETAPERSAEEDREFEKTARELLQAAVAGGETRGIAAFPPPGTDPIKIGIVVPKSFDLPEGFIRHYQITDDGRRLEPILMFSPDYDFVDASGQRMEIPEDGIVPQEMAPAGLPIRVLAMPKNPYGP